MTGASFEALPGRLRVRGGGYWEPGRFEGVGGRGHATFGLDLRVLEFRLFGVRQRIHPRLRWTIPAATSSPVCWRAIRDIQPSSHVRR